MEKNTSKLWDDIWVNVSNEEAKLALKKEEVGIRWQRIESLVLKKFGSFSDLKVIELGAGLGTNACLMASKGANVTVLDYSDEALRQAKLFFKANGQKARFVKADILNLSKNLLNKFDVSCSFGLTEHFINNNRIIANKAHFDVLKKRGVFFISVPNKSCPPYRIHKKFMELLGFWKVGEEYPYSRKEFIDICKKIGVEKYGFFGSSIITSLNFINPYKALKKVLKVKNSKIKKEKGTSLDKYFGYALVLWGEK